MKRYVKASSDWPSADYFEDVDLYEDDEVWCEYFAGPEDKVSEELQIFIEPSVQAGMGGVFIFDESGAGNSSIEVDFEYWCSMELQLASQASSSQDYQNKFKEFVEGLIEQEGWER